MDRERNPNCCEAIGIFLYGLFRAFIILCPIIAQIRVIYMLCKPEDYLRSPDKCTRVTTHIQLILGTYIIGYVVIYGLSSLFTFLCDNFSNRAQPVKMHIAQTIVGLVVFKIYYELFKIGQEAVYNPEDDCCKQFVGTVLLTILTIGLFLIYRYFQATIHNWNSPNDCKRETARFVAGLGVFYIYYHLWKFGLRCVYKADANCGEQTLGTIILSLVSVLLYLPYRIIQIIAKYWNHQNDCYRQTARFFGGLGIFYIYYRIWKYAAYASYDSQNKCQMVWGHIIFTIITVGLFIPFRIIQAIINNWYSESECKRETSRFLGGLGIFYIYYHMWKQGLEFTYRKDTFCQRFLGHLLLTLATVGLFIPFRILQAICQNWNSGITWKKETARFFGGLGVFYIYYQLWHQGLKYTYRQQSVCGQIGGHILLTLATVGLFIPFRIIQAICQNWNSQVKWKKEFARCVGLLVIFYIWYKMMSVGFEAVYRSDEAEAEHRERVNSVFGHILLSLSTLGLYIIYKPFEQIYLHWYDQNDCKRQTARFFGGLGVFYIYYQILFYGVKWVYKDNEDWCRFVSGHILLVIASVGIYIPWRIVELIITKWNSQNFCHRQTARIAGGLVIFFIWYQMFKTGFRWVYRHSNSHCETFTGYVFLTISTLGIFVPIQLVIKGVEHVYHSDDCCINIIGHVELTIVTIGLFLPFRLFQLICNNWYSDDPVKRHISRGIVGLVVFYLWFLLVTWSFHAIYSSQSKCDRWLGRGGMLLGTLGLYLPVMIVEYFIEMFTKLNESYFLSQPHITGVAMASVPTVGLVGVYTMTRMEDRWPRYIGNLLFTAINAAAVYFLVTLVVEPAQLDENYKVGILAALCVASYPFLKFMAEFIVYNQHIRKILAAIKKGIHYSYLGVIFGVSKVIGYPLYLAGVSIGNGLSRMNAKFRTFTSRVYSRSANRRWIWAGYFFRIQYVGPEHPEYYAPVVYEPQITQQQHFLGWDERQQIRINKPEYILDQKRQNHQYVMDCVAGNVQYNFNRVLKKHSMADIVLWYERYTQLADTLRSKAFYERMVNVSLDSPENFRQVDEVLWRLDRRRKEIVNEPIQYFNAVESEGEFQISTV